MSDALDSLRREVAVKRGLAVGASEFLHGATLDQIEASAAAFARLATEREPAPVDPFVQAATGKAERKERLLAIFAGRPPVERDEQGRFVARSTFDGGARAALPAAPQSHDEWLGEVLRSRAHDRGASF